jgi:branched-chain amino acid transport system substrate-binding protein
MAILLVLVALAACTTEPDVAFETRSARVVGGSSPAAGEPSAPGGLLPTAAPPGADTGGGAARAGSATAAHGGLPAASNARTSDVVKLGTILPLQGGQRDFGEPVLRATQAFVDEVNARGGVNGHRLQLVAYSACLVCQDEALQAARRLVEQDHVFAIVNTYVLVVAFQPVIKYLVDKGVPLVQGAAENQTSDALSPVNVVTAPPGLFYARFLPTLVAQYAKVKRVAITYLDVPSESNGLRYFQRELARQGVEVVDVEPVDAAEDAVTDMDSVVIRMRSRGAQGVLATNPILLIYGRLAAARQGWGVPWVGEAAWSQLVEDSCGATCDDVVLTDTAGLSFTDRDTPQMREFLDTMARRYPGGQVAGHTLAAWVGMQLTTEILRRLPSGPPDAGAFLREIEQLRDLDLGTTAPLTFTPDRHMGAQASTLLKLRGGHYVRASEPLSFGEAEP